MVRYNLNPTYDNVPSYALYFFHFLKNNRNVSVPIQRSEVNLHVYFWTLCLTFAMLASSFVVELDGIEPTTPCLQSRCSPN